MQHADRAPAALPAPHRGGLLLVVTILTFAGCRITDLALWRPPESPAGKVFAVQSLRDLIYYDGPDADRGQQRLDLFLPIGKQDYPVVVLVHGGFWMMGDKNMYGLTASVGQFLASQGIGAVLVNYRLSPGVKHPAHVQDVARAAAWTRAHIAAYGGRPDQLFLVGHSAGGHLVALLVTDERYLKAEGLQTADLRGVIALSGVYHIPPGNLDITLGGATERAFRLDEVVPPRSGSGRGPRPVDMPGLPARLNVYGPAFGNDPHVREDASPVHHVRPGLPPFLIFSAGKDLPTLASMAQEFHQALLLQGCEAQLVYIKNRNHNSILFRAIETEDPVAQAMLTFIRGHCE